MPNGLIFHPWAVSGRPCGTQGPPESSKDPSALEKLYFLEPFGNHFGALLALIVQDFLLFVDFIFFTLFSSDCDANLGNISGSKIILGSSPAA